MKIGFIGLGKMGKYMAGHILEAGYDLTVHDLRKRAAANLIEKGAKWADTPESMAKTCRVVISCVPNPGDVENIVYNDVGLLRGWKKGDIYIDMSTNSPTLIRRISEDAAKLGTSVLDAPVSGGDTGAQAGTLTIMVGGDSKILKDVLQIFKAMGNKVIHVGDVGCGDIAKLVNNMISLSCNVITAEGFVLGVKAGIDSKKLHEIVSVSTGNNFTVDCYSTGVLQGNFNPGFRLALAAKDMGLALSLSREYGLPLPVASAAEQKLMEAKAAGMGDKNVDANILLLEKLAGVKVRASGSK